MSDLTLAAVFDVAYRVLSFIYMLLASEHYLRTNHAWLYRRLMPKQGTE